MSLRGSLGDPGLDTYKLKSELAEDIKRIRRAHSGSEIHPISNFRSVSQIMTFSPRC